MKAIILAAGEGTRLRPYTEDRPKCMVEFQGKPIIDYTLENMIKSELENIIIITGYKENVLKDYLSGKYRLNNVKFHNNLKYDKTNMVNTLFCSEDEFDDDIIISYSDIVYKNEILEKLKESKNDISVIIDNDWRRLWEYRMEDPLQDAETLKLDSEGNIIEIGKKPNSYEDIEGQYIGLIKISKRKIEEVSKFYKNLSRDIMYDGNNFENMYMTTFIQLLIDNGFEVGASIISGGWIEIDTAKDLQRLKGYKI